MCIFQSGFSMSYLIADELLKGRYRPLRDTEFTQKLSKNFTLIFTDSLDTFKWKNIEEISDYIGVDKIGLVTHSSFDIDILDSDRIHKAVLCDPLFTLHYQDLCQNINTQASL